MSENNKNTVLGGGLTFLQVLFLIFLVLKLTGKTVVASWSWWWVTAPLWGGFAIIFGVWALVMIILGLTALFNKLL
ncbi:MAG: transmembrane Fragile-X-F family protein [Clostridia bacterium]|nr:transmembrane Fragile-X-F family protein [Clostridia bacterium]